MYGEIKSAWKLADTTYTLNVTIPPNTTANIVLPSVSGLITESGNNIYTVPEISNIQKSSAGMQLTIGSGDYTFVYTYKPTVPVVKH
jgi:alpha-L-rhamnosidase